MFPKRAHASRRRRGRSARPYWPLIQQLEDRLMLSASPPLVTIAASQPDADADSDVAGTFAVDRTGDTAQPLVVDYVVSGTATAGTDYQSLPGSVTIPAGASSTTITVDPLVDWDPRVASPSTVVATLSPSAAYTLGAQSLTATDTLATSIAGTQGGIVVGPSDETTAVSLRMTGIPTTVVDGVPFNVTVTALTAAGTVFTGYTGTVSFGADTPWVDLPSSYTFTAADAGAHTFSVTFTYPTTDVDFTVGDGTTTGLLTLHVAPAPATKLTVVDFPNPGSAGAAQSFLVQALDSQGNVATGYTGTVHFTSSDGAAALPSNYTFTVADAGQHAFTATLNSTGAQSITAADTANATIAGTQSWISVAAAQPATVLAISGMPATDTAGTVLNVTVKALTAGGAVASGYRGTVHFSTNYYRPDLPPDYTFTAADAGVHTFTVELVSAGARWVRVADTANNALSAVATTFISPAAPNSLSVHGPHGTLQAGSTYSFTVIVGDEYGNVATNYAGTVQFASTDPLAALPADYTFTAADAGVHTFTAVPRTPGNWLISAYDTQLLFISS